tara:strand:- start:4701 stop:4895 length:195 start_codon:yes stop_codon:yes gene_type:complete
MMSMMIWTIIFKNNSSISSAVMTGPHSSSDAIAMAEYEIDGEVLAIIPGKHNIHFKNAISKKVC